LSSYRSRLAYSEDLELNKPESTDAANTEESVMICTFCLDDATHIHHLNYAVYRKWEDFAELLRLWKDELGVECFLLWDESEAMEILAGDWDARVRPRWRIHIVCGQYTSWNGDENIDGDGVEELSGSERVREDEGWWFASWKDRVEKGKKIVKGKGGWWVGVVGMLGTFAAFLVIVLWASKG
jgi:hypothetical protein